MTRRPLVAGNWKLPLGPRDAARVAAALRAEAPREDRVELAVFPTALSIAAVVDVLDDTAIHVGIQWAGPEAEGAYTGRNSPVIAREAGCQRALIGHSEVRAQLGVTDPDVHAAIRACLAAGLLPMVCVGETLDQRDAGAVDTVLRAQVDGAFGNLHPDEVATCTLAYEPVWAIGTGRTASPDQAQAVHAMLREHLRRRYPAFVADSMRILYGGSVKPANARALLSQPDIDGALVGGASLDPAQFLAIAAAAF